MITIWNKSNLLLHLKYEFKRSIKVLSSINNQVVQSKEAECPAHVNQKHPAENDDYHCSLEEWESAKPFEAIPGPRPYPIIGNTWRFIPKIGEYGDGPKDIYTMFEKFHKNFGDVMRMEKVIGRPSMVNLFDPADIEKVYKLEGVIPERDILPSMTYFREHMRQDVFKNAKGLLTSHGEDWYNFRNKVNTIMMQPKMVKQYIRPVDDIASEFIERIKSIRGEDKKIKADFWKETNKWALESIAYLALNTKLGCLQGELPEDSVPAQMIRIAEEMFYYGLKLDFEPSLWKHISTPLFRKAMKTYSEQVSMAQSLIENAIKVINEKENTVDKDPSVEVSVLEKLLKIDYNVAFVMALDMLLAGVDTTSTALINLLYYIALNQDKQEKLRKEILSILPDKSSILSIDDLNSMHYLKACIKEAARLYPVTPGTMRELTKNLVLKGYQIPKGKLILFPHMYISLQENQYPRPKEFLPERWLRENINSEISFKKAHPFSTMHFGFGSRSCIGRRFAELELELATVNFFRNFNISWIGAPPNRKTTSINYLEGPYNFIFEDLK